MTYIQYIIAFKLYIEIVIIQNLSFIKDRFNTLTKDYKKFLTYNLHKL